MLYLKQIKAQNIFAWKDLDYSFSPNTIYSIKGHNGAGKSSIFEMVTWVLYKKTTKDHVKGDFGKTDGQVSILLEGDGDSYLIERNTKTPAQPTVNGEAMEQEQLEKLIGCSYSVFMSTKMCGQDRVSSFINEKSDTGRAKIFGEMLGCAVLDKIRTKVQKLKTTAEMEYETQKSRTDLLEEQLDKAELDFNGLSAKRFKAKIEKDKKSLEELKAEGQELSENYQKLVDLADKWRKYEWNKKSVEDTKKDLLAKKKELEGGKKAFNLSKKTIEEAEKEINELEFAESGGMIPSVGDINKVKVEIQTCLNKFDELKEAINIGTECPTCGAKMDVKHIMKLQKEQGSLEDKIEEKQKELKTYQEEHDKYKADRERLWDKIDVHKGIASDYQKEVDLYKKKASAFKGMKENLVKPQEDKPNLVDSQRELNEHTSRTFELEGSLKARVKTLKSYITAKKEFKEESEKVEVLEKKYYVAKWLFDNIPIMKLKFINENKIALEDVINENISAMGIPFMVKITTQKTLKKGGETRDKFNFEIINTTRNVKAGKNDLSGGQKTALLLATQMGISDISGIRLGFEIYDEIYGSLDAKNKNYIIDALKNRAENQQVLTISHEEEIANCFDDIIQIEERGGYSYVRQ